MKNAEYRMLRNLQERSNSKAGRDNAMTQALKKAFAVDEKLTPDGVEKSPNKEWRNRK